MQLRKPNKMRSVHASRGPAAERVAAFELARGCGVGAGVAAGGGVAVVGVANGLASGDEAERGPDVLLPLAVAALALLAGCDKRGADAARVAADAVAVEAITAVVAAVVEAVLGIVAEVSVVAAVTLALALVAAVLVSFAERLAATLTVDEGVVVVMLLVVVRAAGSGIVCGLWGLRVNQNAPAPMATAARPTSPQGARDLPFLADGGNCAGAVSKGMALKLPASSALRSAVLPKAPGSVMGICVGAN